MFCKIFSNSLFLIISHRDILLGSPQRSDHNWNIEDIFKVLIFTFKRSQICIDKYPLCMIFLLNELAFPSIISICSRIMTTLKGEGGEY